MTYELFWEGDAHETGNGFWTEGLEPFTFVDPSPYKFPYAIGQGGEVRFCFNSEAWEPQHAIDCFNSQLEAYRSKQLSLNIKGGKGCP